LAKRLSDCLKARVDGDVLVIAHSFGTVLAYELLLESSAGDLPKIWFITVGSPLSWVPSLFLSVKKKAPPNQAVKRWANMFHHADPVAGTWVLSPFFRDNTLADDYKARDPIAPEQPVDWAIYHFEADPHADNGYLHSRSVQNVTRAFATGKDWPFDAVTQP
jgi:predicted alpha/beta hydrolase family esterase